MKTELTFTKMARNAEDCIEINGRKLRPDRMKGYVEFKLAHPLPVVCSDFSAIYPSVVGRCYSSMQDQMLDINHIIRSYNPKENPGDMIIGAVVEVEFVSPGGGKPEKLKAVREKENAPYIRCAATMFKAAQKVPELMEKHLFEKPWSVSMENFYRPEESGVLLPRAEGEEVRDGTPEDIAVLGYDYWPASEAPKGLLDLWDPPNGWKGLWKGVQPVYLCAGLEGDIQFGGVALTPRGKEKEAEITQMLASEVREPVGAGLRALERTLAVGKEWVTQRRD